MEPDILAEGIPEGTTEYKFCADCSFLVGVRLNTYDSSKWRCGHKDNKGEEKLDLVTGLKYNTFIDSIYDLREDETKCGPKGNWYEKYVRPDYSKEYAERNATIGGQQATEIVFDEATLAANKAAAATRLQELRNKKKSPKITDTDLENL
jgi:hypothetical protein